MPESDLTIVLATDWQAVTAGATIAYAACTAFALLVVLIIWKQLKATNRARTLEALTQIYAELHSDLAKLDRALIYESSLDQISDSDFEELMRNRVWQGLSLASIERTADMWHLIGLLAHKRIVKKDVLFTYFAWPLLKSYKKMRSYITRVQSARNPAYAQHFVVLARDFEKRYKEKHGSERFSSDFGVSTLKDD